jgi:hypothetical protein
MHRVRPVLHFKPEISSVFIHLQWDIHNELDLYQYIVINFRLFIGLLS